MFIKRCVVHWALSELSFSESKDLFSVLNVMENTFHFSHRIYYVLLLKSVIMLFFLPHVFILLSLYCRLFWSRLLFSFSWIINRADFTSFMPMLNLPHFYFAFQFIRQPRSLVTIASCFLEALRHGAKFISSVFSIDTKLLQEWIIFMFTFIWSYFLPQTLFICTNHVTLVVIWIIWNQITLFWGLGKYNNNEIKLWKSQI